MTETTQPGAAPAPGGDDLPSVAVGDVVRVVRGDPDEVELAALVAGILAAAAGMAAQEAAPVEPPPWTDPARRFDGAVRPGPSAWRWSLHPR